MYNSLSYFHHMRPVFYYISSLFPKLTAQHQRTCQIMIVRHYYNVNKINSKHTITIINYKAFIIIL